MGYGDSQEQQKNCPTGVTFTKISEGLIQSTGQENVYLTGASIRPAGPTAGSLLCEIFLQGTGNLKQDILLASGKFSGTSDGSTVWSTRLGWTGRFPLPRRFGALLEATVSNQTGTDEVAILNYSVEIEKV